MTIQLPTPPRRASLLAGLILLASLPAGFAFAQGSFVIDTPVVETNGGAGNVLDGDDTITVTDTGSVTPPSGEDGLSATGDNNRLFSLITILL